jgi:hypothetical protein
VRATATSQVSPAVLIPSLLIELTAERQAPSLRANPLTKFIQTNLDRRSRPSLLTKSRFQRCILMVRANAALSYLRC